MDNFCPSIERVIEEFGGKYVYDPEAFEILEQLGLEPVTHRKNSDYYNYEFFIMGESWSLPSNKHLMF